jgi:spermidine/putrescine-binding protein
MEVQAYRLQRWPMLIVLGLVAVLFAAGCGRQEATTPSKINSVLVGHYSPQAIAAGHAFEAQEAQRAAAKRADSNRSRPGGS